MNIRALILLAAACLIACNVVDARTPYNGAQVKMPMIRALQANGHYKIWLWAINVSSKFNTSSSV